MHICLISEIHLLTFMKFPPNAHPAVMMRKYRDQSPGFSSNAKLFLPAFMRAIIPLGMVIIF